VSIVVLFLIALLLFNISVTNGDLTLTALGNVISDNKITESDTVTLDN